MYFVQLLNSFNFNNNTIGNYQIQSEPAINAYVLVYNRQFDLSAHCVPALAQLVRQTDFVC